MLLLACRCSAPTNTTTAPGLPTYEGITVLTAFPAVPDSAGATDWQTSVEPPPGMGIDDTTYDTAGAMLTDLARSVSGNGGQARIAFIGAPGADAARAVIQSLSAPDDSVLGEEYDLALRKGPKGWYVAEAGMRTHCHRGVTADRSACI
jgi:hypothetical protein